MFQIPKQYITCEFKDDITCGDWYNGEKYWIGVSGGAGLLVGVIRYLVAYPRNGPPHPLAIGMVWGVLSHNSGPGAQDELPWARSVAYWARLSGW